MIGILYKNQQEWRVKSKSPLSYVSIQYELPLFIEELDLNSKKHVEALEEGKQIEFDLIEINTESGIQQFAKIIEPSDYSKKERKSASNL
jgi:hypothetical protein